MNVDVVRVPLFDDFSATLIGAKNQARPQDDENNRVPHFELTPRSDKISTPSAVPSVCVSGATMVTTARRLPKSLRSSSCSSGALSHPPVPFGATHTLQAFHTHTRKRKVCEPEQLFIEPPTYTHLAEFSHRWKGQDVPEKDGGPAAGRGKNATRQEW